MDETSIFSLAWYDRACLLPHNGGAPLHTRLYSLRTIALAA